MGTIRTDAGQAPVNVTVEEAHAPAKVVRGNASETTRTDAGGASQGTTTQRAESKAEVSA